MSSVFDNFSNPALRRYDQALALYISQNIKQGHKNELGIYEVKTIPSCFATPDRAHAQMSEVIERSIGVRRGRDKAATRPIEAVPLPFASIFRVSTTLDVKRYNFGSIRKAGLDLGNGVYSTDLYTIQQWLRGEIEAEGYVRMPFPLPVFIQYQIDYWARNVVHLDAIEEQYWLLFRNLMGYIDVEFEEPWATKTNPVLFNEIRDTSQLETGFQNRELRKTVTLTVSGWMWSASTQVTHSKFIKQVDIELWESENLVDLDELLATIELDATIGD